ncbi:hypothetical protein QO058_16655 [Bosea vestrisii]|uniref:hypothetical protein n=1 Tax=Bosea vestrisii TaxID=151416 RepID=UPI0024DF474F|nr:hypothetical protein [Bosea vestrisii]WID94476.1 hypothetical protein QO058_16655 [Bosea vestrisii]
MFLFPLYSRERFRFTPSYKDAEWPSRSRSPRCFSPAPQHATREEGRRDLDRHLGNHLEPQEAVELEPLVNGLIEALRADTTARQVVHARIGLDLDVGGDALLKDIQGAREMVVKAKTTGNFTLDGVKTDGGKDSGK